jgi:hypothetical protein
MMPARGKIRQDDRQITGTAHDATTHNLKLCDTTVNHLPLVYKRRRQSPSRGEGGRRIADSLTFPPSPTILALCLNQPLGTWRLLLLLSRLACSSPLRQPRHLAIQRHECTPTGRTTHSRNQDKPRVLVLLSIGHRETDLSALTSYCRDYFPHR